MMKIENEKERREWKRRKRKWIDNRIGDKGAKAISESLKINSSLTTLLLGGDEKTINDNAEEIKFKTKE